MTIGALKIQQLEIAGKTYRNNRFVHFYVAL